MPPPKRPRQSGVHVFWALLEVVEKTSALESQALADKDFNSLEVLQEAKRVDFARLVALGQKLGFSRADPVLNRRLLLLEETERRNALRAGEEMRLLGAELKELESGQKKLRSVRNAYAGDTDERPPIAEG